MKRYKNSILTGFSVILLSLVIVPGCTVSDSPSPVGPFDANIGGNCCGPVDPTLLRLNPEFTITPVADGSYYLRMAIGAGGTQSSPEMHALHGITGVRFDVFMPNNQLLATMFTDSLPASGVMNGETGEASVVIATSVHYMPTGTLPTNARALMVVQGMNGVATKTATFPTQSVER